MSIWNMLFKKHIAAQPDSPNAPSPYARSMNASSETNENAPFPLEFHFTDRKEEDMNQINSALSGHALSEVTLVHQSGYLATETTTHMETNEKTVRYWFGLDDLVLRCTPAKPGESFHYRIDAMVMDKSTDDCGERWRHAHPDRVMRTMVLMEYPNHYVAVVLHHEKQ